MWAVCCSCTIGMLFTMPNTFWRTCGISIFGTPFHYQPLYCPARAFWTYDFGDPSPHVLNSWDHQCAMLLEDLHAFSKHAKRQEQELKHQLQVLENKGLMFDSVSHPNFHALDAASIDMANALCCGHDMDEHELIITDPCMYYWNSKTFQAATLRQTNIAMQNPPFLWYYLPRFSMAMLVCPRIWFKLSFHCELSR